MDRKGKGTTQYRERRAVSFIRNFKASHSYAPSRREIAAHIGLTTNGTGELLKRLDERGVIELGDRDQIKVIGWRNEDRT